MTRKKCHVIDFNVKILNYNFTVMHLSMLSPRGGGGTPGICGAFDFSEEFLVKIPTVGPQNWVKSDQISPPFPSIYIENE